MTIIILKGVGHMWNGDLDNIEQIEIIYEYRITKRKKTKKEIEMIDFKVNQRVMKNRLTRRGYKEN